MAPKWSLCRPVLQCLSAVPLVAILAAPVAAVPVSYHEALDGDLSADVNNPTDLGKASIGLNTARGSVIGDFLAGTTDTDASRSENFRL